MIIGRNVSRNVHKTSTLSPALLGKSLPPQAILYLLSVVIPIMFNVGPLLVSGLRLYLLLLIIPLMVQLLSGRFGRVFIIDILFILHIVWVSVALAVNNPDMVVSQIGSAGVEFLGGYLVGRAYIRTPEAFAALCRWLVFIVLCTAPLAIFETFTARAIIIEMIQKLPGFTSVGIIDYPSRLGFDRVQVVFAHPIHYGLFCSVALSLAFVALKNLTSLTRRYTTSFIVILSGFLSLSSGALLAMILQLGLILWAAVFDRIRWRWWLLFGLFCLAYIVIDIFSNRTPLRVFMSYATFSAHNAYYRAMIFEWGMHNIWGNPTFGIGMNDWVRPWYMASGSMDNFWLVLGVRYGIPGLLLLALGYFWGLFRVMRRNFDADTVLHDFRRAWVFVFLGLSFTLSTVHVWTNIYSFVFFMFGAGMWLITVTPRRDEIAMPAAKTEERRGSLPYSRFSSHRTSRAAPLSGPE